MKLKIITCSFYSNYSFAINTGWRFVRTRSQQSQRVFQEQTLTQHWNLTTVWLACKFNHCYTVSPLPFEVLPPPLGAIQSLLKRSWEVKPNEYYVTKSCQIIFTLRHLGFDSICLQVFIVCRVNSFDISMLKECFATLFTNHENSFNGKLIHSHVYECY